MHTNIPNEVLWPLSCVNKVLGIVIVRICTLCTLLGREGTRVREREGWREQQTFRKMLESLYSSALAPVISATSYREITFAWLLCRHYIIMTSQEPYVMTSSWEPWWYHTCRLWFNHNEIIIIMWAYIILSSPTPIFPPPAPLSTSTRCIPVKLGTDPMHEESQQKMKSYFRPDS